MNLLHHLLAGFMFAGFVFGVVYIGASIAMVRLVDPSVFVGAWFAASVLIGVFTWANNT